MIPLGIMKPTFVKKIANSQELSRIHKPSTATVLLNVLKTLKSPLQTLPQKDVFLDVQPIQNFTVNSKTLLVFNNASTLISLIPIHAVVRSNVMTRQLNSNS